MKVKDIEKEEQLYQFLLGDGPDNKGRRLNAIWGFTYEELEQTHDYIQWMFPTDDKSQFNKNAPLMSAELRKRCRSDVKVIEHVRKSFAIMLDFYGFELGPEIKRSAKFEERLKLWLTKNNHNYLRFTRIIKSLKLFGLDAEALQFFNVLMDVCGEYTYNSVEVVTTNNVIHWLLAVKTIID